MSLLSPDVHRLHPGGGEPLPAAAGPVRPTCHGELQPTPPGPDLAAHLRRGQRVLPLAVEAAAQPVCPHQVGGRTNTLWPKGGDRPCLEFLTHFA